MRALDDSFDACETAQASVRARAALAALGLLLLAVGLLTYLTSRPPGSAMAMPAGWHHVTGMAGRSLPGADWLPSLLHPWAFGLLSATVAATRARQFAACLAWCGVNMLFEAGQHPALAGPLAQALGASACPGAGALARYVAGGTFDPADMVAAAAGTLAACGCVLVATWSREKLHA